MRLGASLVLFAIGAVLKWGISYHANGINLQTIGVILMVVGVVGFVATVLVMSMARRTDVVHHNTSYGDPSVETRDPRDVL